jgi:glutaminyl-tRNA synthetase
MPTLRGLRRRGYPAAAIREFCGHIGVAKVNGVHEIELLESFVRTHHNAHALRRMAVLRPVEVVIDNWPEGEVDELEAINNPEDEAAGTRAVPFSGRLWIERDDFMLDPPKKFYRLAPGREVRLRAGYFITCTDVETDAAGEVVRLHATYDPATRGGQAPDGRKVKATIHWVSAEHAIDATAALYDRLFTDPHPGADGTDPLSSLNPESREMLAGCKLEPILADTPAGEVVQFERLGYFARDRDRPMLFHRTVGLRDEWANIQKRQAQGQGKGKGQAKGTA